MDRPLALILFAAVALTAWLVGDRRAAAGGEFDLDQAAQR